MKQKNDSPTKEQAEILRRNKLNPAEYIVVKDLNGTMIVKHRYSDEHKLISKRG